MNASTKGERHVPPSSFSVNYQSPGTAKTFSFPLRRTNIGARRDLQIFLLVKGRGAHNTEEGKWLAQHSVNSWNELRRASGEGFLASDVCFLEGIMRSRKSQGGQVGATCAPS